jgi:hypothetical protein
MCINALTGLVTWVPFFYQLGPSSVTVLATDQFGDTSQQTFSISVSAAITPLDPFASSNRPFLIAGPIRGGSVASATSGPALASLTNNAVDQFFGSLKAVTYSPASIIQ